MLAVAGGIAIAGYLYVSDARYYPVARISAPEGLTYTAFSDEVRGRDACVEANQKFIADLRGGCPACTVAFERCESKEEAIKLRVEVTEPVVITRSMQLAVAGPRELAKATCENIVQDLVKRGFDDSRCLQKSGSEPDFPERQR